MNGMLIIFANIGVFKMVFPIWKAAVQFRKKILEFDAPLAFLVYR